MPLGSGIEYFGTLNNIPTGWLVRDGSAVSRTEYSELFAIIGTAYGAGDGSTTFNLPNDCGRIDVGYDSSDTDFNIIGKTGGEKTHTLTIDEIPNHNHSVGTWYGGSGSSDFKINSAGGDASPRGSDASGNTGGGQAHNNLQPYIVCLKLIKAKNTTPTMASIVDAYSTSTQDGYSANYVNTQLGNKLNTSAVKTSSTTSDADTYSCTFINNALNNKQNKIKTKSMTLTTDSAGNQTLGMWTQDTIVLSVYQKSGTAINGWCTLYTYNGQYMVHTGNFNGTAISGTQEFEVVYIER